MQYILGEASDRNEEKEMVTARSAVTCPDAEPEVGELAAVAVQTMDMKS